MDYELDVYVHTFLEIQKLDRVAQSWNQKFDPITSLIEKFPKMIVRTADEKRFT